MSKKRSMKILARCSRFYLLKRIICLNQIHTDLAITQLLGAPLPGTSFPLEQREKHLGREVQQATGMN